MTRVTLHGCTKHGMSRTPEYAAWASAKHRCCNDKSDKWIHYGGRGIKMCKEWRDDFLAFYLHIGPKPKPFSEYSLDRLDNEGNYEPGNVRWATVEEQHENRRPRRQ